MGVRTEKKRRDGSQDGMNDRAGQGAWTDGKGGAGAFMVKSAFVVMNFTGAYESQTFYRNSRIYRNSRNNRVYGDAREDLDFASDVDFLELKDLQGTNCYCDEEAEKAIKERIQKYGPEGIHFLDSGNYHYVSKLWLDKIEEEFELLVFDHHTDMQEPMFGDILSCGGWIKAALDRNPLLKRVYLAGPPENGGREAEEYGRLSGGGNGTQAGRVIWMGEDDLKDAGCMERVLGNSGLPLYISLDKDILDVLGAVTNWDQGGAALGDVLSCIRAAAACRNIIGLDICGEDPDGEARDGATAAEINDRTNGEIVCKLLEICDILSA